MKFCSVIDKEFKITVLKKVNELPKEKKPNSERQFNEITHIYAQKHRFKMRYLPEIENIKKNQTEILELKKLINERENATENICSGAEHLEDRTSEAEDRNFEITQL